MANLFPRSANFLPFKIAICIGAAVIGIVLAVGFYGTDKTQAVNYQPDQPIPYDHELHAGEIGLDCRHCHSFADKSGQANIPSANVCWNCHGEDKGKMKSDSPKLAALRDAVKKGTPIRWVKVWDSPDYVYFDHSAHLNRGVSCVSCHGEVNKMRKVYRSKAHTMGFCIDCHNAPEDHLRPQEFITDLQWNAKEYLYSGSKESKEILAKIQAYHKGLAENDKKNVKFDETSSASTIQKALGLYLKDKHHVQPKTSCQTCHN